MSWSSTEGCTGAAQKGIRHDGTGSSGAIRGAEDKAKKKAAEIPVLEPAQTLEVKATLKPGVYRIYCTLPGRKDAGMVGTLTVQ